MPTVNNLLKSVPINIPVTPIYFANIIDDTIFTIIIHTGLYLPS